MPGGDGAIVATDSQSTPGLEHIFTETQNLGSLNLTTIDPCRHDHGKLLDPRGLVVAGAGGWALNKKDQNQNLAFDKSIQFVTPFVLNAINPMQMLIGTNYLYVSTDPGNTLT